MINLWKEVPAGSDIPNVINIVVEIPKGSLEGGETGDGPADYGAPVHRQWRLQPRGYCHEEIPWEGDVRRVGLRRRLEVDV